MKIHVYRFITALLLIAAVGDVILRYLTQKNIYPFEEAFSKYFSKLSTVDAMAVASYGTFICSLTSFFVGGGYIKKNILYISNVSFFLSSFLVGIIFDIFAKQYNIFGLEEYYERFNLFYTSLINGIVFVLIAFILTRI